jgi:Holliday junction resolvase
MRRASKVDANHAQIVDCFRKMGCSVLSLAAMGKGVPDLLVATKGITWLVEVKSGKSKENELQKEWAENWQGARALVRDTQGVETVVKTMRSSQKNGHG